MCLRGQTCTTTDCGAIMHGVRSREVTHPVYVEMHDLCVSFQNATLVFKYIFRGTVVGFE